MYRVNPHSFFRALCTKCNVLMIADEVQTGLCLRDPPGISSMPHFFYFNVSLSYPLLYHPICRALCTKYNVLMIADEVLCLKVPCAPK